MKIGIFGTFDVENYGDLLFPIIARRELEMRLGKIELYIFSYNEKRADDWPYDVISLRRLDDILPILDAILIGGGHIVRFDKKIALNYSPPMPDIAHPCGYWLTPALAALAHNIPVIWNAPSSSYEFPAWGDALLSLALTCSSYVSMRDADTLDSLRRAGYQGECTIVPDTAFNISSLLGKSNQRPADIVDSGVSKDYIVVQSCEQVGELIDHVIDHVDAYGMEIVALPISPALGDSNSYFADRSPLIKCLKSWPDPTTISSIVGHSRGIVAHSLHLSITGVSHGVPVLRKAEATVGKYALLKSFEAVSLLSQDDHGGSKRFWDQVLRNRSEFSKDVDHLISRISRHWDQVAVAFTERNVAPRGKYALMNALVNGLEDAQLSR